MQTAEDLQRWVEIRTEAAAFASTFAYDEEPQWYPSPINLREGKSGKVKLTRVVKPIGEELSVVPMREALLRGRRPAKIILEKPMVIHELSEEGNGVWMTDLPCELNQAIGAINFIKPEGSVLVGGLGLGILPAYLSKYDRVENVTVVEKNKNVINLCANHNIYDVVQCRIERFLAETDQRFDAIFLDTWQGQSESTFWHEVFPLRRLVQKRFGAVSLWCWKEDEFMAQAYTSLRSHPGTHWFHTKLRTPMSKDEATSFLTEVGLPDWEKRYGALVEDPLRKGA